MRICRGEPVARPSNDIPNTSGRFSAVHRHRPSEGELELSEINVTASYMQIYRLTF